MSNKKFTGAEINDLLSNHQPGDSLQDLIESARAKEVKMPFMPVLNDTEPLQRCTECGSNLTAEEIELSECWNCLALNDKSK